MAQRYRPPWHASLQVTNPSPDDYATVAGTEFNSRTFTVLIRIAFVQLRGDTPSFSRLYQ